MLILTRPFLISCIESALGNRVDQELLCGSIYYSRAHKNRKFVWHITVSRLMRIRCFVRLTKLSNSSEPSLHAVQWEIYSQILTFSKSIKSCKQFFWACVDVNINLPPTNTPLISYLPSANKKCWIFLWASFNEEWWHTPAHSEIFTRFSNLIFSLQRLLLTCRQFYICGCHCY